MSQISPKELSIIHNPTHIEFFIDGTPVNINRKTYHKHLFKYQKVKLVTFFDGFYDISYKLPLLLKLFSRGKTIIQNAQGEEKLVTIPALGVFMYMTLIKYIYNKFILPFLKFFLFTPKQLRKAKIFLLVKLYFPITYWYFKKIKALSIIRDFTENDLTDIDRYWGEHTVNSLQFITASQSRKQLEWRFSIYPFLREYMQLYEIHQDRVIMDYGCGPGNDVTGFALYSKAKKIIGVDISKKALRLAQHRLALHRIKPERIEFIHISDKPSTIPLEDNTIDYINCEGVIHHTSYPEFILKEFHRVLKPQSKACIMVYNYDSIWMHIHAAYLLRIQMGLYPGLSSVEVFSKCMDGENCPKALCYRSEEFISICNEAGFNRVEYLGGFFGETELQHLTKYKNIALNDKRLEEEHKEFLRSLEFNKEGYPTYKGKTAGFGGIYNLYKT